MENPGPSVLSTPIDWASETRMEKPIGGLSRAFSHWSFLTLPLYRHQENSSDGSHLLPRLQKDPAKSGGDTAFHRDPLQQGGEMLPLNHSCSCQETRVGLRTDPSTS